MNSKQMAYISKQEAFIKNPSGLFIENALKKLMNGH